MNPAHLVRLAEESLRIGGGPPNQVMINRAISTAYYALFHALCWEIVDHTVRRKKSDQFWQILTPVYRAMQHGTARAVFEALSKDPSCPDPLKQVGRNFLELQQARIRADYDPSSRHTRRQALDFITLAEASIQLLPTVPLDDRRILAVRLITKQR